tara:strand:- start:368 stop:562 length:195 start_codon:yes stop_codon:yes gene_type:complete
MVSDSNEIVWECGKYSWSTSGSTTIVRCAAVGKEFSGVGTQNDGGVVKIKIKIMTLFPNRFLPT